MKAVTVQQPRATLLTIGATRMLTFPWKTDYRGPLAIHAAWRYPRFLRSIAETEPVWTILCAAPSVFQYNLPRGAVLGSAILRSIVPVRELGIRPNDVDSLIHDLSPDLFAWLFERPGRFPDPLGARGRRWLWDWEPGGRVSWGPPRP